MSFLKQVENVDRVIMEVGNNFTLKNTILWNNKTKDGYKLDPITERSYESNKYAAGQNTVKTITFRSADYLVFEYRDFQNKLHESVFVSYPNLFYVKAFFSQVMELLATPGVYTNDSVAMEYKDVFIESAPLAGGKKLAAYPIKFSKKDFLVDGICLLINNQDYFVEMDLGTFAGMNDIIQVFNIYETTNQVVQMALTEETNNAIAKLISLLESQGINISNQYQQTHSAPSRPAPVNFSGGGRTFNNRSANNKPLNRPTPATGTSPLSRPGTINNIVTHNEMPNIPDSEVPFTMGNEKENTSPTFERAATVSVPKDQPNKENTANIFSLDNITAAAKGFDASLLNDAGNPEDIDF